MSNEIDALQARLEKHFAALSDVRRAQGLPVFALEHGLDANELSSLTSLLKGRLATPGYVLRKHWLVWIIYATEQGYDYDGDEYWYTFERRMPLWDRGWRPSLRAWFEQFRSKYSGLRPVGRWANFFTIIAWPITHALLPKDLQGQLARTLYDLRYQLVTRLDASPAEVGRYVAGVTDAGSSRFENFLEQEELVGRIVLALLDRRTVGGVNAILPETLDRIVQDIEKARNAREWLHDTRRAVEVARLRGTARLSGIASRSDIQRDSPTIARRPTIRPALSLRRTSLDEWTPILELPSFRQVADLSPDLGTFLRRTRCSVVGSPGIRPPGWLLTGVQRRVLETWPAPGKPVLSFQAPNAAMEHLLSSDGCISPGPTWVFRVGSDGQAVEVLGRLVRPHGSYVLIVQGEPPKLSMGAATSILCDGVRAVRIDVPAVLEDAQIAELKSVGLSIAETIRIWPVGLAARSWDGEGVTEWLASECPCFAIEHDHPVAEYELRLDAGPVVKVEAKPPGVATFIRLHPLSVGNHVMSVSVARSSMSGAMSRPVEGIISLSVRSPNPWISGSIGHMGLIVGTEPPEPTLDDFWEGLTQLNVLGPAGRHVTVSVELLNGSGAPLAEEQVAQLTLPLGPEAWQNAFSGFVRREKDPWSYLQASSGRIIVDGEELGVVHVPLQRDVSPVRWVWHRTTKSMLLRLVDDHDTDVPLDVAFHPFARPLEPAKLAPEKVCQGLEPPAAGGLFVARFGDSQASLVVSMRKVEGGLGGLLVEPEFDDVEGTQEEALAIVRSIVAWSDARLVGALVVERRQYVVSRLKERLYCVMCGPDWGRAEENLRLAEFGGAGLDGLLRCFNDKRGFGHVLARDAAMYVRMPDHIRLLKFAALARRYGIAPGVTTKPALDLGDVLDRGLRLSDRELQAIIRHLWDHPALTAGARILQLLGGRASTFQQEPHPVGAV